LNMCDYSLMAVPNRLACEGEELMVHRFPTGTIGLASPPDINRSPKPAPARRPSFWSTLWEFFKPPESHCVTAVCIPPGSSLTLHDIPVPQQKKYRIGTEENVIFTQTSASVNYHRDAVRFQDGREMCLQDLSPGQRVSVISVSLEEREPVAEVAEFPGRRR